MDLTSADLPGPGGGRRPAPRPHRALRAARRGSVLIAGVTLILAASAGAATARGPAVVAAEELAGRTTAVTFSKCSELASITTISPAQARSVVPASFILAGDNRGAPFVVRVADCDAVTVDGGRPESATVAQLGVSIVSPDGSGDINNYTVWYYTSSRRLAASLHRMGVAAQWAPGLRYDLAENPDLTRGTLTVDLSAGRPPFTIDAPVSEPVLTPTPFQANWWAQDDTSLTKMSTPIPELRFGLATATLHTPRASQLGRLLGSGTVTFTLLDTFNRFGNASMSVSRTGQ
jgi:hypothetical protein